MREICKFCGTSFDEILENGFVGCEHCYQEIEGLRQSIDSMFKGRKHKGRTARGQYGEL